MPVREPASLPLPVRLSSLILCLSLFFPFSPLAAKTPSAHTLESGYAGALAAADRFLQAWQSGDLENGIALLTRHGKDSASTEMVEQFFSNNNPSAYEIGHGKLIKGGRYEFPVVLIVGDAKNLRARRRFSSIVVADTGNNDWAV